MFENIPVLLFSQQLSVSSAKDPFGNLFTVSGIVKTNQIYSMSPRYELLGIVICCNPGPCINRRFVHRLMTRSILMYDRKIL